MCLGKNDVFILHNKRSNKKIHYKKYLLEKFLKCRTLHFNFQKIKRNSNITVFACITHESLYKCTYSFGKIKSVIGSFTSLRVPHFIFVNTRIGLSTNNIQ